jgi:hypothetical protein
MDPDHSPDGCSECGAPLRQDDQFCPQCGAATSDPPSADPGGSTRTAGERGPRVAGPATLASALNYPKNCPSALGNPLFVGAVLNVLAYFLVPMVVLTGYAVETFRRTLAGDPEPPKFADLRRLLVDGLKGSVVAGAYLVVPVLVLTVAYGLALPRQTPLGPAGRFDTGVFALGLLVALPLLLVASYLLPAAFAGLARTDRLGAAFAPGTLLRVAVDATYFVGWLKAAAVYLLYFVILGVLTVLLVVPIVGWLAFALIVPVLQFYIPVAMIHVYGRAYATALDLDADGRATGAATA